MTSHLTNDEHYPSGDAQQRAPTLYNCLHLFLTGAPTYYVRWEGREWDLERFYLHLQQDTSLASLLERLAVVWDYGTQDDPYSLHEGALFSIRLVEWSGRVTQQPNECFEVYPIFTLARFRQFVRMQPQGARFSSEPNMEANPLCQYVRECFGQLILLSMTGTGYLADRPDADDVLPLPFWAQLFQRLISAISYDNLAEETLNWQDTVLNLLEICELLVSQYGELRNLIPA